MIPVERLLYKIDLRLNKVASLAHQHIATENKILALNEAQIKLIKNKIDPNNNYGLGFDAFKKRYEDLQSLVEPAHKHSLKVTEVDTVFGKWVADLRLLEPEYMFYVDGYALADRGTCKGRIIYLNHDLTKHSDVPTLTANNNYKPSFEYQESFDTLSSDFLEIYSDGTFTYTDVFVSYLRYPVKIDYQGYIHLDNTSSTTVDCELPEFLEDELINFTIEEISYSTENVPAAQFTQQRLKTQE